MVSSIRNIFTWCLYRYADMNIKLYEKQMREFLEKVSTTCDKLEKEYPAYFKKQGKIEIRKTFISKNEGKLKYENSKPLFIQNTSEREIHNR